MIRAGDIVLVTGIMAAGKSTVAQALAERLDMSVHLRGDSFRRAIVNGQAEVTPGNWTAAEAQLLLRYRIATAAAVEYARSGFAVIYQDVVLGDHLNRVLDLLDPAPGRILVVVLAPEPEFVAARDRDRLKTGYGDWTPHDLDRGLREETPRIGLWVDGSDQSVAETVDAILQGVERAVVRTSYSSS